MTLPLPNDLAAAPGVPAVAAGAERTSDERGPGAVFTRPWVVEMILDLADYTADNDLGAACAIEPSCGEGAFVIPMVRRLVRSAAEYQRPVGSLGDAVRAFDISSGAVAHCRKGVERALREGGVHAATARRLAAQWVTKGDFLLDVTPRSRARWVLGNPPYLRIEDVDRQTLAAYRERWSAMTGRADVYVAFLQAALAHLEKGGTMAVICADRWMRNQYGAKLRQLITESHSLKTSLVLHEVDAFEERVWAYPAVVVVRSEPQGPALVAEATGAFDPAHAQRFVSLRRRGPGPLATVADGFRGSWTTGWFSGAGSWPAGTPERLALITDLQQRFGALGGDETVRLGVGVATGADDLFVRRATEVENVEASRLLPYVAARDLFSSTPVEAKVLVNPWLRHGELTSLDDFPGMAAYLRRHAKRLRARYIAQRNPAAWWRTIDAVDPDLADKPKLLLPDLKARIEPVLDVEGRYPGHSLYYLTSDSWDLRVLGGLLLSDIAAAFVEAYSVRMANGYLRVSAQYLRKVPLPRSEDIDSGTANELRRAFDRRDRALASAAAARAYGLA